MGDANWNNISTGALLAEFFAQDDLKGLAADAGALLECPLLVLDDTFHVTAHYKPLGFSDAVFQDAVRHGEVTYEFGAIISQSKALSAGAADYVLLDNSAYLRRFAPLISSGVRSPAKHPGGDLEHHRADSGKAGVHRDKPSGQAL